MIRACQRAGLSIAEIRTPLAELPEGHIPGAADWDRLAQRLRHELRHRIDDLNRALQALSPHHPSQEPNGTPPGATMQSAGPDKSTAAQDAQIWLPPEPTTEQPRAAPNGGYARCWSHGSTTLGELLAGGQTGVSWRRIIWDGAGVSTPVAARAARRRGWRLLPVRQAMTLTFSAWGPFWPWVMSSSTFCPSSRLR
jgi:DNA-binding transcriptional MerR regulator